jgi:AraC-like DNA-binding protein
MVRAAIADYPAGARMPPRVIDDFEFVWMLQGQARLIDGTGALLLSPGQLLLVPPGVRHSFEWDQARATRHGYVHFRPERETGLPLAQVRLRTMTSHDPLAGLCAYLLWLGQGEDDSWERHATQTLRFLLTMFVSAPLPHDDDPPALAGPLLAAIDHMRRQWSQMPLRRVRVEELAAAAHVSRGYLNRLFRAGFGLSAATALEHARCGRAETLLARTDTSPSTPLPASAASPTSTTSRTASPASTGCPPARTAPSAWRRRCSTTPASGDSPARCGSDRAAILAITLRDLELCRNEDYLADRVFRDTVRCEVRRA